jgi:peroxiredoxin
VILTGNINHPKPNDSLRITRGNMYQKVIAINSDGSFSDTLKVIEGDYRFKYADDYGLIYLKNGNESSLTFDHADFYNTLVYGGDDADINNFAVQNYLLTNKYFTADMTFNATREDIDSIISNYKVDFSKLKLNFKEVDSFHLAKANAVVDGTIKRVESLYAAKVELQNALPKGSPSPIFKDYENYDGGTTSLSDYKGKYVYFLFWSVTNTVSKKGLTDIKQLELDYKDKNIEFVCISLDDEKVMGSLEKTKELWKRYLTENNLTINQLIADNGWQSDFLVNYQIKGIPRFVLIDPDGNIVSADAPSPSNPKLIELLNSLKI